MKRLLKKVEDIMVAITFAEAGEYDTAREMMGETATANEEKVREGEPETA